VSQVDHRQLERALQVARVDPQLGALTRSLPASQGWIAHREKVEHALGVKADIGRLVVAEISAAGTEGFYSALDRRLVLDLELAKRLEAWSPAQDWMGEVLHELIHACETIPAGARVSRPGWWRPQRRQAELVITEGMVDQLTAQMLGIRNLGAAPFGYYTRSYLRECMVTGAVLLASIDRTDHYDGQLQLLFQQPRGSRVRWAAGLLDVSPRALSKKVDQLLDVTHWDIRALRAAVSELRTLS
jgi:hypothetical protein